MGGLFRWHRLPLQDQSRVCTRGRLRPSVGLRAVLVGHLARRAEQCGGDSQWASVHVRQRDDCHRPILVIRSSRVVCIPMAMRTCICVGRCVCASMCAICVCMCVPVRSGESSCRAVHCVHVRLVRALLYLRRYIRVCRYLLLWGRCFVDVCVSIVSCVL